MTKRRILAHLFERWVTLSSLGLCVVLGCKDGEPTPPASGPSTGRLRVLHAEARACEAVVADDGRSTDDVAFEEGVRGVFLRRGQRVAVTFIGAADRPFGDDASTLRFDATNTPSLEQATCFDAGGRMLPEPALALETEGGTR